MKTQRLRITTMNAVGLNAVLLLILLWNLTAVCQADDDDIRVICEDVTGTVGEEVTLTCSVSLSLKCSEKCIKQYKFLNAENNDSTICKEKFPDDSCEQRDRLTCSLPPTTAKTEQFRFFVQTLCGKETTEFTVTITDTMLTTGTEVRLVKGKNTESNTGDSNTVTISVASGFILIIIIIITLTIIYKRKANFQLQWIPVCLAGRRDEDNSDCPENGLMPPSPQEETPEILMWSSETQTL